MVWDVVGSRLCMKRGCGQASAGRRYILVNLNYAVDVN